MTEDANDFKSLANSFGNYFCDRSFLIDLYSSAPYFGALLGFIFVTFFSDNYGRKKTCIAAWSVNCLGCLFLIISKFTETMETAIVGLALMGFGSDSVSIVTGSILSEQC